ncbi:hypothetical protein [Streptomyces fulvorobeus]|uniref:Uncharacterized protein n=1 Tax=Streptomyces fulvorobeus TaxID=284028 RepID=A0A7J0BYS7_9ACTN|nr:hypothetical protein [Streptomyces fulvorobeus]NYE39182.1 hypothetical protein [Streptomyces fulvorobeus]GFM95388.1 hypothetical protein Sfulv_01990 [Streptomyces fulvorobeus]
MTAESGNANNFSATNAEKTTAKRAAAPAEGTGTKTAEGAERAAHRTEESASKSAGTIGGATSRVGRAAASGLQSGQHAVTANASKVAGAATTAWTVVKHRKAVVTGAAAGVAGVAGAAFALGRSTAKPQVGPLTRLARGRI